MTIEMGKEYTYRNGKKAKVLCTDRPSTFYPRKPVLSMNEQGDLLYHNADGTHENVCLSDWDLIEPKKRFLATCYLAVCTFDSSPGSVLYLSSLVCKTIHEAEELAKQAGAKVFAIVPVVVDVEEGQGLEF